MTYVQLPRDHTYQSKMIYYVKLQKDWLLKNTKVALWCVITFLTVFYARDFLNFFCLILSRNRKQTKYLEAPTNIRCKTGVLLFIVFL